MCNREQRMEGVSYEELLSINNYHDEVPVVCHLCNGLGGGGATGTNQ